MRLPAFFAFAILAGLAAPAFSQGASDREPGDTRAMSCTRNTASLLVLSREMDAEAGNLKAEPGGGFTPSTRAFFETLCPKVRRHTAAVDRDCDELKNNDDIARHLPRVEALMFARKTVPFCDQFFKAPATAAPPDQAASPPGTSAGGAEARAAACTRNMASASQIRLEIDRFGPSLKAGADGRFSPEARASLERICPQLRRHAAVIETNCEKLPQTMGMALQDTLRFETEHFLRETLPFCDQALKPAGAAPQEKPEDREAAEFANGCIVKLRTMIGLQGEFQDYFAAGPGKRDYESGRMTPRMTRYFQSFCPKLRNAAGFREADCMGAFSIVNAPIDRATLDNLIAFAGDIGGLCDQHHKPRTMTAAEYQRLFDREVGKNRYPETVSAICENGQPRFSAVFEPFPKGRFGFYAHHGASDDAFRRQDANYTAAGLQRVWHNRIECGGRPYNQAVWTSK